MNKLITKHYSDVEYDKSPTEKLVSSKIFDYEEDDYICFVNYRDCLAIPSDKDKEHILKDIDLPVYSAGRAGSITYHGKGQIAIHFIINLKNKGWMPRDLIDFILTTPVKVLNAFLKNGYSVDTDNNTGLYLFKNDKVLSKIGNIGIKLQSGISSYGVSINFDTDISKWNSINPCGMNIKSENVRKYFKQNCNFNTVVNKLNNSYLKDYEKRVSN